MKKSRLIAAWGKILAGRAPLLSVEVTRECPLSCPGCYAYGENHLGGAANLRDLSDLRGNALVKGVIELVKKHRPIHVSIVGGEPLIRHRELSRILPALNKMGVETLIVTSAVVPIPAEWNQIPGVGITVSVDGLPPDHDKRRAPATYERILENIKGRRVDIGWVVTNQMMGKPGYFDEYLQFWTSQPEVKRIWLNFYTPQLGEQSEEMLTPEHRQELIQQLPGLKRKYRQLLMTPGIAAAFATPPSDPQECTYAQMSVNYSADLRSRVEPCFYGGEPDCSQCGCAVTAGLHWIGNYQLLGPLRASHVMKSSIAVGRMVNRLTSRPSDGIRWGRYKPFNPDKSDLVQIH